MKVKDVIGIMLDELITEMEHDLPFYITLERKGLTFIINRGNVLFDANYPLDANINLAYNNNIAKVRTYIKKIISAKKLDISTKDINVTFYLTEVTYKDNTKCIKPTSVTYAYDELEKAININDIVIGLRITTKKPLPPVKIKVENEIDILELNSVVKTEQDLEDIVNAINDSDVIAYLVKEILSESKPFAYFNYATGFKSDFTLDCVYYDNETTPEMFTRVIPDVPCLTEDADGEDFDGRVYYADEIALRRFWEVVYDTLPETISNTAFPVVVNFFHYKGKDWYVRLEANADIQSCPSGVEEFYFTDDGKIRVYFTYDDFLNVVCPIDYINAQQKVADVLSYIKETLELEGYINSYFLAQDTDPDDIFNDEEINLLHNIFKHDNIQPTEELLSSIESSTQPAAITAMLKLLTTEDVFSRIKTDVEEIFFTNLKLGSQDIADLIKDFIVDNRFGGNNLHPLLQSLKTKLETKYKNVNLSKDLGVPCFLIKGKYDYHLSIEHIVGLFYCSLLPDEFNKIKELIVESIAFTVSRVIDRKRQTFIKKRVVIQQAKNVFVSFDDSIQAGNCKFGTKAFCKKHNIDIEKIGAIRGDALLELETSPATLRAVNQAIERYKKLKK